MSSLLLLMILWPCVGGEQPHREMSACTSVNNNASATLVLFGAFGRHNFGDLLMPHVVSKVVAGHLGAQVIFADLLSADMRSFGGHCVHAIGSLLRLPGRTHVVHVGGETLGCRVQKAARFIGVQPSRLPWDPPFANATLSMSDPAYVLDKSMFLNPGALIANSIGGVANAMTLLRLRKFDFVSVREHATLRRLQAEKMRRARWAPDSVFALRQLYITRVASIPASVRRVQRACSGTGYVAVQLKEAYLLRLPQAAAAIRAAQTVAKAPVVLFRAGAAATHDSLDAYDAADLPRLREFEDLDIWSIVSLIAHAKLVVTTSLHVQIIAAAWGVPRLQLSFSQKLDDNMAEFETSTLLREGNGLVHPARQPGNTSAINVEQAVARAVRWLLSPEAVPHVNNTRFAAHLGRSYMKTSLQWLSMIQRDSPAHSES